MAVSSWILMSVPKDEKLNRDEEKGGRKSSFFSACGKVDNLCINYAKKQIDRQLGKLSTPG